MDGDMLRIRRKFKLRRGSESPERRSMSPTFGFGDTASAAAATADAAPKEIPVGPEGFAKEVEKTSSYRWSYSQLWNVLNGIGVTRPHPPDIIHDELNDRGTTLMSVLTTFNQPSKSKTALLASPSIPPEEVGDAKMKMKWEIKRKLNVTELVAIELMSTYLIFEYNGPANMQTLNTALATSSAQSDFLSAVEVFYERERLGLIYSAQVILSAAADPDHLYHEVLGAFVSSSPLGEWTKRLCTSLHMTNCDEERIQILHALILMIHNFGAFPNVLEEFNKNYKRVSTIHLTPGILQAEAVLIASFVQSGTEKENDLVQQFIIEHLDEFKKNDLSVFPMLSYFRKRYDGNETSTETLTNWFTAMSSKLQMTGDFINLVGAYSSDSFKYRHGIGPIALKCYFEILEVLLTAFRVEELGNQHSYFQLLDYFLRNKEMAVMFMCEQEGELFPQITNLYASALYLLPLSIDPLLSFWISFVRTANDGISPIQILEKVTQISVLAEYYSDVNADDVKVVDKYIVTKKSRRIGSLTIPPNTPSHIIDENNKPFIILWVLKTPSGSEDAPDPWEIITTALIIKHHQNGESVDEILHCFGEFLIKFCETSSECPQSLLKTLDVIIPMLQELIVDNINKDPENRCAHVALLLRLVTVTAKFDFSGLRKNAQELWPFMNEYSFVVDLIMRFEILRDTKFIVLQAFLKSLHDLIIICGASAKAPQITDLWYKELIDSGLAFFFRIMTTMSWRAGQDNSSEAANGVLYDYLRVIEALFNLPESWNYLKVLASKELLRSDTMLLAVVKTDGENIQNCRIHPNRDNLKVEEIVHSGLSILNRILEFQPDLYKTVDPVSISSIIPCLAKLFRQRIMVDLSTFAIKSLTKFAQDSRTSIQVLIGNDISAFCDSIMVRLSSKSENSDLRVAAMEFLTVCIQVQLRTRAYFLDLTKDRLPEYVVSLLKDDDDDIPPAVLALVRVLVREGYSSVLKTRASNIWELIGRPIQNLESYEKKYQGSIILCTMNIFSFELYREGNGNTELCKEVEKFLASSVMKNLLQKAIENPEGGCKSLLAIKHFLMLLVTKPELSNLLNSTTRKELSDLVTQEFWENKGSEKSVRELGPPLAELMLLFAPDQTPEYVLSLSEKILLEIFTESSLSVQVPLISCLNKALANMKKSKAELSVRTIETLVKIISTFFGNANNVYREKGGSEQAYHLLSLAVSMAYNITQCQKVSVWLPFFEQKNLIKGIVQIASAGLKEGTGRETVVECLIALIQLSFIPETADAIRNENLGLYIWTPVGNYGHLGANPDWTDVFLLCCQLNSTLISTQKHYYLAEAVNFWGLHAGYSALMLEEYPAIVQGFPKHSAEINLKRLLYNLHFNAITLNAILEMVPYISAWQLEQGHYVKALLDGVLVGLHTSQTLMNGPNYLLHAITPNLTESVATMTASGDTHLNPFKMTPQLMDLQNKLWNHMLFGVHIFLKLQKINFKYDLALTGKLVPLLCAILDLSVLMMPKVPDKRSHFAINSKAKIIQMLEKGLKLLFLQIASYLVDSTIPLAERIDFKRKSIGEVGGACDNVKKGLDNEYCQKMCSKIERLYAGVSSRY